MKLSDDERDLSISEMVTVANILSRISKERVDK